MFPFKPFAESLSKFPSPFLTLFALIRLCALGVYNARVKRLPPALTAFGSLLLQLLA